MRKKSKPELSSSQGDLGSISYGSGVLSPSISSPQLGRSSDPSVSSTRMFSTPPPLPQSPKSTGSLDSRSRVQPNGPPSTHSQFVGSNKENRNRGFTIGSAFSPPTSPVLGN
mgnify:CR=1 FL=1